MRAPQPRFDLPADRLRENLAARGP